MVQTLDLEQESQPTAFEVEPLLKPRTNVKSKAGCESK